MLTSQRSKTLDTRLFYKSIGRENNSDKFTVVTEGEVRRNHLLEYDKHQAGLDANYRLDKANKLTSGAELSAVNIQLSAESSCMVGPIADACLLY